MSALRELLASFSINVDDKRLQEASRGIDGFVGKLKDAGAAIATAFGVAKLKGFLDGQLEAATALRRSSATLGIATQALQEYQLAAKLADVDQEAMTTGLRYLNRSLSEAAHGSTEFLQQFQRAGIAVRDGSGHTRAAGDVLAELADKVSAIQSPAEKTELAMRLLGRGGSEMIPLLSKGSAAFAEARAEVVRLGGGLDETFLKKAKEASHAQHELDFALVGLKAEIASELLPTFVAAVTRVKDFVVAVRQATGGTNVFRFGLEAFAVVAGIKTVQILVSLVRGLAAVAVGAVRAAAAFVVDWAAAILPITAILGALDLLYYVLTGNSLHGVVWDWLFGGNDPSDATGAIDGIAGKLQGLRGPTPGSSAGGSDTTKALVSGLGESAKGSRESVRALRDATGAIRDLTRSTQSFFGRGGPGQTPHADIPLNWAGGLPKGAKILTAQDAPLFGTTVAQMRKTAADFAGGSVPTVPGRGAPATYLPSSGGGPSLANKLASEGITIQQTNKIDVAVHTSSDRPKAVGEATGQGVATAVQRANDRAYNAVRKP